MASGRDLVALAETRIGEVFQNVLVLKDTPNWHGQWDCAEFASWVVFQKTKALFGYVTNSGNPATTEAYSGPNVKSPLVRSVQRALKAADFDPGKIDGENGPHCVAAVMSFEMAKKLVADGTVGPATAKKLGVSWPA